MAITSHGMADIQPHSTRLYPSAELKYDGIHVSMMNKPQLWQKCATTIAHTALFRSRIPHGVGSDSFSGLFRVVLRRGGALLTNLFQRKNHTNPSTPNGTKMLETPYLFSMYGLMTSPSTEPMYMPLYTSPRLRLRNLRGTHFATTAFIAGMATPSPIPIMTRTNARTEIPMPAANGVSAVASDHHTTPRPSTYFPPYLSARTPPSTCVHRYPQKKDDCMIPCVTPSHPYVADMGMMATDMLTRSMLHSMKATKQRVTTRFRVAEMSFVCAWLESSSSKLSSTDAVAVVVVDVLCIADSRRRRWCFFRCLMTSSSAVMAVVMAVERSMLLLLLLL
mmetsp:Transcript_2369/g.6385  ORF Transcript_2369/g.6385 Transcript_2369/m.6385 type:complete len:335 (-) Transcript_2369:531-1535(-)